MKAAVFRGNQVMEVTQVPDPVCPDGGLVLRVEACGICGSDMRTYRQGTSHPYVGKVIGHEVAGVVIEASPLQSSFKVGDALVLDPVVPCGHCYYCVRGQQNLCENMAGLSAGRTGGYAQKMAIPAEAVTYGCCIPLPPGLAFHYAIIAETLSAGTKAHEMLGTGPGDTVVVIGAGPLGNMHVEMALLRGAAKVIQTERIQNRLDLAREFGASVLINSETEDPVKRVLEETGGRGADIVINAAPSTQAAAQSVLMARKGGKVMWFAGLPPSDPIVHLDGNVVHYRDLTVYGTIAYTPRQFQLSVELVGSGKINPRRLVTDTVPLEQINEGFQKALAGQALKVVVTPNS